MTYEIENVMWAIVIVSSESRMPICVNSSSADTPATISGVTSGISISTLALPENQRVRARTRPNASSVPSTVETTHRRERDLDARHQRPRSDSLSKNASYHWRLKPSKFCTERTLLNENSTTTASGRNTKKSA